jgi:Flp pilus assembly pilin Flp
LWILKDQTLQTANPTLDKAGHSRHAWPFRWKNSSCGLGQGGEGSHAEGLSPLWKDDSGQDIAEYAVMLAVILVLVVGTLRLIGSNANNAFSAAASVVQ